MLKNVFILSALLSSFAALLCMEKLGMQELAKHKAEFQAGMKKLLEQAPEDLPAEYYSPIRYEHEMRKNKEMRRIAKELEVAFNAVSAKSESPLQPPALLQDADYSAVNNYIKEIKEVQYTYDLGTPRRIEAARQQRDLLVSGWEKITTELARSKEDHQSLANTLTQVRAQLQEKTIATYDLAGANATKESTIKSLEYRLQEKEREVAQLKKQNSQASEQSNDLQNRMASLLALFEASKITGWENAFVQSLKTELRK